MKQYPEWYWVKGLHDAKILSADVILLDFDYTERSPRRNYLSVKIDSSGAMYETNISEIRFFNAKPDTDKNKLLNSYWDYDEICFDKKYRLELTLIKGKSKIKSNIEFDDAEVIYCK